MVKQLTEHITAAATSAESKDKEQVKQMSNNLQMLSNEMTMEKPRRACYEMSLNGIKEAASAIGEIAKPVVDTVLLLMKFLVP